MRLTLPTGRLFTLMLAALVLPVLLIACNGDDDADTGNGTVPDATTPVTGNGATEVDVEMVDIDYSVDQLQATAGEALTINFSNTGALEHDFAIESEGFSNTSASGGEDLSGQDYPIRYLLQPGEEGSFTFTPSEAGEYDFFCSIPGHREAGMAGTLTVSD